MKKNIEISCCGTNSKVGKLLVNRLMPNKYIPKIGPFVFLDHLYPTEYLPGYIKHVSGEFGHPHKGIATCTYILSGELEHIDSKGNHGIVSSGGVQWMKAGNGIIHDELPSLLFQQQGGILHTLQFWINLPSQHKLEEPEYLAVQANDIPEFELPENAGILRIIIGQLADKVSPVKTHSKQFLYHLKLNPKSGYTFNAQQDLEYAAFVPKQAVFINQTSYEKSQLVVFQQGGDEISFANGGVHQADLLVFGGEPYTGSIVAEGPFVMNSRVEIAEAYRDFFNGNYGKINYS